MLHSFKKMLPPSANQAVSKVLEPRAVWRVSLFEPNCDCLWRLDSPLTFPRFCFFLPSSQQNSSAFVSCCYSAGLRGWIFPSEARARSEHSLRCWINEKQDRLAAACPAPEATAYEVESLAASYGLLRNSILSSAGI